MAIITEEIIPFDTFRNIILEVLQQLLGPEKEVTTNMVLKNNGVYLEGIMVKNTPSGISPTFYLETLYDMYKDGMTLDAVVDQILPYYEKNYTYEFFDTDIFSSYESVKDTTYVKLINTHRNTTLLEKCPSMPFLDMSAVVYLTVNDKSGSVGSVTVNDDLLETWNMDFDEIYSHALSNTQKNLGINITNIRDFLMDLIKLEKAGSLCDDIQEIEDLTSCSESDSNHPMYIMTNNVRFLGASSLMFNDFKDFAESLEKDLYVIPSSIHEIILVPVDDRISRDELSNVLNLVNETEISTSEFLSANVYYYSRKTKEITM